MRYTISLILLATACVSWSCQRSAKTGYVDNLRLYEAFELKKELEAEFVALQTQNQQTLDSLTSELRVLAQSLDSQEEKNPVQVHRFNQMRQEFLATQETLEQRASEMSENYTDQVWLHLNEYVQSYAEEHGYDYVLGGSGQGNIMYAREGLDITEELVAYTNQKYRDAS